MAKGHNVASLAVFLFFEDSVDLSFPHVKISMENIRRRA